MVNILGISHIKITVKDLYKSLEFYHNILGLSVTESTESEAYLRGYEENLHHSLYLERNSETYLDHFAFIVSERNDLDALSKIFDRIDIKYQYIENREKGIKEAVLARDPAGFPIEFIARMDKSEIQHQDYYNRRGASVLRLDHITLHTPHIADEIRFYKDFLGFIVSEEIIDNKGNIVGIFLTRKRNTHDIAFFKSSGPAAHHIAYLVKDVYDIIKACDILGSLGHGESIEYGPGRHKATNGVFLYLRDISGHRIELFTGDYFILDPSWNPIVQYENPNDINLWGQPPPKKYREEKIKIKDPFTQQIFEINKDSSMSTEAVSF